VPGGRSSIVEWTAPSCTAKAMYASRTVSRWTSPQWGQSTLKVFLQAAARLLGSVSTRVGNRRWVRGHVNGNGDMSLSEHLPRASKMLGRGLKFHLQHTRVALLLHTSALRLTQAQKAPEVRYAEGLSVPRRVGG
jgi:hypothetical protein